MKRLIALALLAACTQSATASLVATVVEPPGDNCAAGGQAILVGADDDGDGELDADEVTSTAYVCRDAAPARQLVTTAAEPAGAHCTAGGQAIQIGADTDGDGVLDPSEVTTTSYVCSGPAGVAMLAQVETEPEGANCALGGQALHLGLDSDGDGVLDPTEVTSTSYVCASTDDLQPLIRVDTAGTHCSGEGSAIHVGLDLDGDAVLDDSEIQTTTYLCGAPLRPTVIDGDVIIHNSYEMAQLDGVVEVTGDVACQFGAGAPPISFPTLERVGGTLQCTSIAEPAASLPRLVHARALVISGATVALPSFESGGVTFGATTVSLPAYRTGYIRVDPTLLTSLSLPVFETGEVHLEGTFGSPPSPLSTLSLPAFVSGELYVSGSAVSSISLPAMTDGTVLVDSTPMLVSLSIPALTSGQVRAVGTGVTSISLPVFESGYLTVGGNASLATIAAPNLTSSPHIVITNNAMFPTCRAQQLAVQANAAMVTISGNDDTAACP